MNGAGQPSAAAAVVVAGGAPTNTPGPQPSAAAVAVAAGGSALLADCHRPFPWVEDGTPISGAGCCCCCGGAPQTSAAGPFCPACPATGGQPACCCVLSFDSIRCVLPAATQPKAALSGPAGQGCPADAAAVQSCCSCCSMSSGLCWAIQSAREPCCPAQEPVGLLSMPAQSAGYVLAAASSCCCSGSRPPAGRGGAPLLPEAIRPSLLRPAGDLAVVLPSRTKQDGCSCPCIPESPLLPDRARCADCAEPCAAVHPPPLDCLLLPEGDAVPEEFGGNSGTYCCCCCSGVYR